MVVEQSEEVRKMFVGGITSETTEAELKTYFGKYGAIEEGGVVILKKESHDQKSKRFFGFITFQDMDTMDKVFLSRPHKIKNVLLEVKHAVPKGNTHPGATIKTKKLFIANLHPTTTKDTILNYLKTRHPNEDYGTIDEINLIMKKDDAGKETGDCKGFGFLTCSTDDFADKVAIHDNKFDLCGRTVELKKSEPRNQKGGGGGYGGNGGYGGYGGYQNYGGYGGYNDPYGYYAGGYGGYGGQGGGGRGNGRGRGRYNPY